METIEKATGKYTYFTDELEFTLEIPLYWEQIYKGKPREALYPEIVQMLNYVKKVAKNRYIIDGGTNHGLFSVPALKMGYNVIGFEPVAINYNSSLNNIVHNNCWQHSFLFNNALSNETKEAIIYVPECPDNASLSKDASIANMIRKGYTEEIIACIKFDDWIISKPEFNNIGLIKLDTQGAEHDIVSGMKDFLSQAKDIYLIAEFEEHLLKMGHSYQELHNLILSFGFKQISTIGNDRVYYKQ